MYLFNLETNVKKVMIVKTFCFTSEQKEKECLILGNDHLTEIHLIEIVFFHLIESLN